MLNFDKEIKKFKPSLEVKNTENHATEDLLDLIKQMTTHNRDANGGSQDQTKENNKKKE